MRQAAIKESADSAARNAELTAGYVGDKRKIDELHCCFRQRRYEDVIIKFNSLKYPERLSESEHKMVELARRRTRAWPWDASNVLERKLNALLERLEIPKTDIKLLAKFVGKGRTIDQATRSEKRAASVGLHSFRHANATAMDSLGIPQQIRKQRLGHSGNSVTEDFTHTFTQDERDAAEKLGEFFGAGWPEIINSKLISFPNLSQKEEGPAIGVSQAL